MEKKFPPLKELDDFLIEFNDICGEFDRVQTATTKFRSLRHGSYPTSIHVADFHQLVCDINWDDNALIGVFWWGLRDDIKDLLLNLPNPLILTEAIIQVVQCNN